MSKDISIAVSLRYPDLVAQICFDSTEQELVEFVKEMDNYMCSYQFSEPLYKYFKQQHKNFKEDTK